jgi:outer membrane protein assembly factor BamB
MSPERLIALLMLGAFALAFACFAIANRRRRRVLVYTGLILACVLGSGVVLWNQPAPVPATLSVYYLDSPQDHSILHALRARDGQQRWQHDLAGLWNSFIGTRDNRLYLSNSTGVAALNAADGSPLWSFQVAEPLTAKLCSNTVILSDPAVILCLEDSPPSPPRSTILALSAATGQEL